jgi:hypothetical protein
MLTEDHAHCFDRHSRINDSSARGLFSLPFAIGEGEGRGGVLFRPNEVRPQPRPPPNLPPRCAQGEGRIGALRVQPATRFCRSDGSRDGLQHRPCGSDASRDDRRQYSCRSDGSRDDLQQCSPKIARIVLIVIPASTIQAFTDFSPSLSPSAMGRVGAGCFSGRMKSGRSPAPLPTSPRAARKGRGGSARFACSRQPASVGATEVAMVCGSIH